MKRFGRWISASMLWAVTIGASAQVTSSLNERGLASLRINGFETIGNPGYQGEFGLYGVGARLRRSDGSTYAADGEASTSTLDAPNRRVTRQYAWGRAVLRYLPDGANRLRIEIDVVNTTPDTLVSLGGILFVLDMPVVPVGEDWTGIRPLSEFPRFLDPERGVPAIAIGFGDFGTLSLVNETDPTLPVWFGNLQGFNAATRYSVRFGMNDPVPAGQTRRIVLGVRADAGQPGLAVTARDAIQRYAAALPPRHVPDRRPLARMFLSNAPPAGGHPPTNPRGWINLPAGTDVRTDTGRAVFRTQILSTADALIANMTQARAQGVVVWDIEGQEFPHMTSYVCAPHLYAERAPEMAWRATPGGPTVADEFFARLRNAGFKVGVCLRPQDFRCTGGNCEQIDVPDPWAQIATRVQFAAQRWGVTLYYVDSNVHADYGWPIPARRLFGPALAAQPEAVFLGEWQDHSYYAVGGPYDATVFDGITGTGTVLPYASAFGAIVPGNAPGGTPMQTLRPQFLAAMRRGDLLLFDGWFESDTLALVRSIAAEVGARPTVALQAPAAGTVIPPGAPLTFTASAANTDGPIARVEYYSAGLKVGEAITPPWTFTWAQPWPGAHLITAIAVDAAGNRGYAAPVRVAVGTDPERLFGNGFEP
ncbi:MAG: Ig-like domain-containing protein [Xanthomonadales bacterium]|jgi:hypothetical protein|nr:Ig-like domain-containing protein [Xanthomonadales bacterium]